jgi:glycosyltransferase involved in cell wall biosynthesis
MSRLSVIIIVLNQEHHIVPCLETVRWADDLVVVDSGSQDRTLELARDFTDRIFTINWPGFGAAKNYALDQARGEWVFSLDTDERVSEALRDEILAVTQAGGRWAGFRAPRKNYFGGRWVRRLGWYPAGPEGPELWPPGAGEPGPFLSPAQRTQSLTGQVPGRPDNRKPLSA